MTLKFNRHKAGWRHAFAALTISAAFIASACTSGTGSTAGGEANLAIPSPETSSTVTEQIKTAYLTNDIQEDELDPLVLRTFREASANYSSEQISTTQQCLSQTECKIGDGPLSIAIISSNGAPLWHRFARAAITLQATLYPEIGTVIYQDSGGQLATMQAQVQSMVSRGVNGIVAWDDFGAAMTSSFAQAMAQGVPVVTFGAGPGDAGADSVVSQVEWDFCDSGERMAKVTHDELGDNANVAFFTGPAGNPQGEGWQKCAEEWFAANAPGIKVVSKTYDATTQQGARAGASALIANGQKIDAILHDYAKEANTVIETYQQAKLPIPPMFTWSYDNNLLGTWENAGESGSSAAWPLYYTASMVWQSNMGMTTLTADMAGEEVAKKITFPLPPVEAKVGDYDPSAPPSSPGPAFLPPELIQFISTS
ncbi:substrate-binding domain-containing protein [Rhodococcus erythropolis]|uniref:substrate-binding domain-containing protein n=1 Tax=Rhodococcus erythropolis TaxID=1833 RepID=UPI0022263F60|nr:substrate-binding domain-containing protein [Rhodococcus erythropolis]MCW2295408.1 ABC-type sugar transport system substrate-binding protein [Rhodococcus erythropolis]